MTKLAAEYQGFLRFITRANDKVVSWFGPVCNNDPLKITSLAAREWDVMSDDERKHFIRAQSIIARTGEKRAPSGTNSFLCYLLLNHYDGPSSPKISPFSPGNTKIGAARWNNLPLEEKEKYSNLRMSELGIDHVIKKRDRLHQMYEVKELAILEYILRTKPKKPISARSWYLAIENTRLETMRKKWAELVAEERWFYEDCAKLDIKRYKIEKNLWKTQLLMMDLNDIEFQLPDFESSQVRSSLDALCSIKDLLPMESIFKNQPSRPLSAFSLYIRAYREQTREERPEFQFGRHLRESAAAWALLPDEEKQRYKEESKKLWDAYREEMKSFDDRNKSSSALKNLSDTLSKSTRSKNGPAKPSHLIQRVPKLMDLFGKMSNTPVKDRRAKWESLTLEGREPYQREYDRIKSDIAIKRSEIREKLAFINELIDRAGELQKVKRELKLLRANGRAPKNLYD